MILAGNDDMDTKVLLVEDEEKLREMIRVYLNANGIRVKEAENGQEAKQLLQQESFDVIVLDLMMPVMDGFAFLQEYSGVTPVLVLSAKSQVEDKLRGFQFGIDDYLTKPFDLRELTARIQVLARRSKVSGSGNDEPEELVLDKEAWTLRADGKEVVLTPKEFEILDTLSRRPSRVFTRYELLIQIWGHEHEGGERVVDTHVKNIRDKCKKAGLSYPPIVTVWGVGYRFGGVRT